MELSKIRPETFVIKMARPNVGLAELLGKVRATNSNASFSQFFDSRSIMSRAHLVGAYANAVLAFDGRTNRTDSMAMEMLLFAAMTDQIGKALSIVGAKDRSSLIVFCSDRAAYDRVRGLVGGISDFRPMASHARGAALRLGLKTQRGMDSDALILEGMAVSRLGSD